MLVNPLSVVVAALAGFGMGWLWYSQYLFADQWLALTKHEGHEGLHTHRFTPLQTMGIEGMSILITSFVLANFAFALNIHGPFAALRLGFWVWLGFQATLLFSAVLFEHRPLQLFYINAGGRLAQLLLISLIVGIWH